MDLPIIVIILLFFSFIVVVMVFYNKGNVPRPFYPIQFENQSNNSPIEKNKTSDMLIYLFFVFIILTLLNYIIYSRNLYLTIFLIIILFASSIYLFYFVNIKTFKEDLQEAKVTCPNCGHKNPQARVPKTKNQYLYGGWICENCNSKFIFDFENEEFKIVDEFKKQANSIRNVNKYYKKKLNENFQDTYSLRRLIKYIIILVFMAFVFALVLTLLTKPQDVIDKFDIFLKYF
jgi:transcription elongation factor Elf1